MLFVEPKTLIVVYKEELFVNLLKKLVETKDDTSDETAVGTRDGSVHIVAWTEKIWRDQKKAGNINNKVLFLGEIKGSDKLIPIIDEKYNEFGIKYGWAGNQAIIYVDTKPLENIESYKEFFTKFCELPIPEHLKVSAFNIDAAAQESPSQQESESEINVEADSEEDKTKKMKFFARAAQVAHVIISPIGAAVEAGAHAIGQTIRTTQGKAKIAQQQYIFGMIALYRNHLEEYIQN